jgi:hypothetical protein
MDTDDADGRRRYVPDKDSVEDEVPDHEAVENLLRPSVENAESSNLMGERNVEEEHSEGNLSDSSEEDDDVYVRSEDKGKQKMV